MKSGSPARVGNILCYSLRGTVWGTAGLCLESQISLLEGGRWLFGVAWRVGFCSSFLVDGTFDADFRGRRLCQFP